MGLAIRQQAVDFVAPGLANRFPVGVFGRAVAQKRAQKLPRDWGHG